jgi:NHL repeat-containing protein
MSRRILLVSALLAATAALADAQINGGGNGQFNYIRGLAVDRKGRIYVSDFFNNRIIRIDDISGTGLKTFTISRDAGYGGPKVVVPMKRTGGGGVIR